MNGPTLRTVLAVSAIVVGLYVILALKGLYKLTPTQIREDEDFDDGSRGLNKHSWENGCLNSIEQLCNYPMFPNAPDRRDFSNTTDILIPRHHGHRLFGYLRPHSTGEHILAIVSNGFAEIWLSSNKYWRDAKRVAYIKPYDTKNPLPKGTFNVLNSQRSLGIHLAAKHNYYFEIIFAQGVPSTNGDMFVQVAWKRPEYNLEVIDREFLLPYVKDGEKGPRKVFDEDLPDALSCKEFNGRYVNKYMNPEVLPYLEASEVENALAYCDYKPSYLVGADQLRGFGQYHGVYKYARRTFSFPYPNVEGIARNENAGAFLAENPLPEQEAKSVVNKYLESLGKAHPGKYKFDSISRVEKKEDPGKGSRYLLELKVQDLRTTKNYMLTEYVYQPQAKNSSLCYPKGMQWNRTADVYLILTAKNLGRWVHHFIKNIERIIKETNDQHLHVVIYDFASPDIDLKQVLERSALTKYHYIIQPGKYSRVVSFTESIKAVNDSNAIVVTLDLHLDIGSQLINDIRKHTIKGKTVHAPQIVFLSCAGSSSLPQGSWYHLSYGTIALYKEDWDRFGGFSPSFTGKNTWGGEDWDAIDGAVKGGLEIERKRGPWVYHYFHSKDGMWLKAT